MIERIEYVYPCFTEAGNIFAIAETFQQAMNFILDRYEWFTPEEAKNLIDIWEIGKVYREREDDV